MKSKRQHKQKNKIVFYFLAIFIIAACALLAVRIFSGPEDNWLCQTGVWVKHGQPSAPPPAETCEPEKKEPAPIGTSTAIQSEDIRIKSPVANSVISSPLVVEGEARGPWYFEASFPIKLLDEEGKVIANTVARAEGDWMTTDFVPFKATLDFEAGSSTMGMLILSKDNPSGDPALDKQLGVPVRFEPAEKMAIRIFWGKYSPESSDVACERTYPVERKILKTKSVARVALEELLAGPTEAEKKDGYYSSLNEGVRLNKVVIEEGVAKADFDEQLGKAVGGSCRVASIRAQITDTLMQFPGVKSVVISINGYSDDVLQP